MSDTSTVVIPIQYLRIANAKMIEREYLLKINNEQDSIIKLKDIQINNLNVAIKKKKNPIIYGSFGFLIGIIAGLLVK